VSRVHWAKLQAATSVISSSAINSANLALDVLDPNKPTCCNPSVVSALTVLIAQSSNTWIYPSFSTVGSKLSFPLPAPSQIYLLKPIHLGIHHQTHLFISKLLHLSSNHCIHLQNFYSSITCLQFTPFTPKFSTTPYYQRWSHLVLLGTLPSPQKHFCDSHCIVY